MISKEKKSRRTKLSSACKHVFLYKSFPQNSPCAMTQQMTHLALLEHPLVGLSTCLPVTCRSLCLLELATCCKRSSLSDLQQSTLLGYSKESVSTTKKRVKESKISDKIRANSPLKRFHILFGGEARKKIDS